MKKNLILTVCFCMLFGLTAGMAATIDSAVFVYEKALNFNNGSSQSYNYISGSEFVFWNNDGAVSLTFRQNEYGEDTGCCGKFQLKMFSLEDFGNPDIFASSTLSPWDEDDNNNGNGVNAPATLNLEVSWAAFLDVLLAEDFDGYVWAHIQDADAGAPTNPNSIQSGVFKWDGYGLSHNCDDDDWDCICEQDPTNDLCPSQAPEPGTILLLGTGIIGLGFAAKRKMTKK